MAKANMTLPDGTVVTIDGSPEEIQKILAPHRPAVTLHPQGKVNKQKTKAKQLQDGSAESEASRMRLELASRLRGSRF